LRSAGGSRNSYKILQGFFCISFSPISSCIEQPMDI
jgi:hypothetical protein